MNGRERPAAAGGRRAARAATLGIALLLQAGWARSDGLPGPDTLAVRFETGAGSDITNELYYEDTFTDTTFLGRRLVSTPEQRYAGILLTVIEGTRGQRRATFQIQNELSLGNKVRRDALRLLWRDQFAPEWRLVLNPSLEWRHDRTFGRDQQEWRGIVQGRLRRNLPDQVTAAELGVLGDLVRTRGTGSEFLLDRHGARVSLSIDHLDLLGDEWRAGYSLTTRLFPDSSSRDQFEHGWEGRWRHPFPGGHALLLETSGRRRQTHRTVATSRDNYWEEAAALEGDVRFDPRWALRMRLDGEALQYDLEDSTAFFDYQVVRGRLGLRFQGDRGWSVSAGPRAELLRSPLNPGEGYREIGGAVEVEVLGARALWSVTPAAGWRAYDQAPGAGLAVGLHSSYAFYELDAFVDQPLLDRLRLRALAALRYEAHTEPSQNSGSVYLSLQLRWAPR